MSLSPEEEKRYAKIIDGILAEGDLTLISAKQIRKSLQDALDIDLSSQKAAIKALIMERFDRASANALAGPAQTAPPPKTNGHSHANDVQVKREVKREESQISNGASTPVKEEEEDEDEDKPPKKKAKRKQDDDAKLAAKLQAEENARTRSTRGGATKKNTGVKKSAPKKRKSAAKIKKADDSDVELGSDGEPKEIVRKGGFHKPYHLSTPLADLVGEATLSRPQVVKKIWAYIKERGLQDPSDKRQILCDDKLQLVFKQDKVHMFTMNKIIGKQLYPVEE